MSQARHARRTRSRTAARALFTAGLGAGLAVATTATASASGDYTVKKGDTLSEIALRYDTDWHTLARINNLEDPDLILIGQQLTLSAPAERRHARTVSQDDDDRSTARHTEARSVKTSRTTRFGSANMSGAWSKVAQCESGGSPRAVNPAGYYGLFQFDLRTWRSVGGSGNPVNASAAEQYMRAERLYAQRGASPWPSCGRYLR
jgi:resuscitation-promoting factor RpfB